MDRFGRKRTIQIGAVIATVGGILQAAAMNLAMILVGRIISGWAVGLMSMSVPVYLAECAHPNTRGMIVGITQQMIGVGFIVSTWVGYGSRHTSDASSFQWRFPLAFQIIPSAFLVIGLIWLPESPRYLIEKDRDDVGLKTLRKLHYNGSNDEWIQMNTTRSEPQSRQRRRSPLPAGLSCSRSRNGESGCCWEHLFRCSRS